MFVNDEAIINILLGEAIAEVEYLPVEEDITLIGEIGNGVRNFVRPTFLVLRGEVGTFFNFAIEGPPFAASLRASRFSRLSTDFFVFFASASIVT